jgi:hypothetical protein
MSAISNLETRLDEVSRMLQDRQQSAQPGAFGFLGQLSTQSLRAHVQDLQRQLRDAKKQRAIEVLQVRLLGKVARDGTIPLYLLSHLSAKIADAIHAASQKMKSGRRVQRISPNIVELLNLRLADLAPGSTRLYITGDVAPDLFGYSLLEGSLEEVFRLFRADDEAELASAVSVVGIRSAREIRDFLTTVKSAELELELSWNAADARTRRWSGNYDAISKLSRSLGNFKVVEPTQIRITGEVITLSSRGRFEIYADGKMYAGTFPSDILPQVAGVHIGEHVSAVLERTIVINTVTHVQKDTFTLVGVEPTGQARFRILEA